MAKAQAEAEPRRQSRHRGRSKEALGGQTGSGGETATSRWEKGVGQEGCVVYTKGRCTESTGCQGSARGTRTCRLVLTTVKPLAAPGCERLIVLAETRCWQRAR